MAAEAGQLVFCGDVAPERLPVLRRMVPYPCSHKAALSRHCGFRKKELMKQGWKEGVRRNWRVENGW